MTLRPEPYAHLSATTDFDALEALEATAAERGVDMAGARARLAAAASR